MYYEHFGMKNEDKKKKTSVADERENLSKQDSVAEILSKG